MYNNSTMDKQNGHQHKSAVLYDLGFWYLISFIFGVAFIGVAGLALDYLWNYFVLSVALRWQHITITRKRKLVYIAIITALGLFIDWLYYEFTWGEVVIGALRVPALFSRLGNQPGLELTTVLIPMVIIGLVNLCASRIHLHLNGKNALVVGVIMAVFTTPWLIVAFVLLS